MIKYKILFIVLILLGFVSLYHNSIGMNVIGVLSAILGITISTLGLFEKYITWDMVVNFFMKKEI